MLRKVVEYVSRGRTLRRRLPDEVGGFSILVSPEAGGLKFWRKSLVGSDPELLGLVREMVQPGSVVWDIGANQGLFSFPAAWLAGPKGLVVAVEPDVKLAGLITDSCAVTEHVVRAPITVVPFAVTDSVGVRRLYVAERARASNHLQGFGNSQSGGSRQSTQVLSVTLDWLSLYFPPPRILKVDVEGAEAVLLRGAATLLRRHRPTLICEVNAQNAEECTEILSRFSYAIYDGSEKPAHRRRLDMCPWSTVAIPEETDSQEGTFSTDLKRYVHNTTS